MALGRVRIRGGARLRGALEPPPDPEIAQVALIVSALGNGESQLDAALDRGQIRTTIAALAALGVEIEAGQPHTRVHGSGMNSWQMPAGAIDCGRSPLTLALIAGVLAGQRFGTRLTLAVESPDLQHLVGSLRARGAHVVGQRAGERVIAPLAVAPLAGDESLRGIECTLPVPDALAKNALLVSGLYAAGPTAVSEPLLSQDHLERMLMALGLPLRRFGSMSGFDPRALTDGVPALGRVQLPGGVILAAAAAALAITIPESHVALRDIAFNPTRNGFFDALRLLGAPLKVVAKGDRAGREPIAEVQAKHGRVRGGVLGGELMLRIGDAIPALCLLGARAAQPLEVLEAEHFASADSSFWRELVELLAAFGVDARTEGAGVAITPPAALRAAELDTREDHRLALTAVLLALAAEGESVVHGVDCIEDVWPGSFEFLRALGARIDFERTTP